MEERPVVVLDIKYLSFDIPMSIQRRVGAAIIAFSRFEHSAELLCWHLLNLDGEDAKIITGKMETSRKFQLLKSLLTVRKFSDPHWERLWKGQDACTEIRNKVAHGVWFCYSGEPYIVSTRMKSETNHIAAEKIPVERLKALERLSSRLDLILRSWGEKLGAQHAKWTEPPYAVKANPDPNPG